jgi:hypothetical protein
MLKNDRFSKTGSGQTQEKLRKRRRILYRMIKYPFLTKAVMPPSDWDPELARRSAREPSLTMRLEHVFGYSGLQNVSPNLFYTHRGDVVYYTAGVGIVYNDDENEQKFFLGHDDDICCLAVAPPPPNRPKVCSKTQPFLRCHFIRTIILPRQARDKHKGELNEMAAFSYRQPARRLLPAGKSERRRACTSGRLTRSKGPQVRENSWGVWSTTFDIKTIVLPRQARDKHRESTQS